MKDAFEPLQRRRIAEDARTQLAAIDAALPIGNAGKDRDHSRHRGAPRRQEAMDGGVAVVDGYAEPAKHRGGRALAHADRAGEAENDHSVASTARRSAGVTSGILPNQAAKAGRAWWSNMPSPSTTTLPRRRAAASSGVSSGT